MMQGYEIIFLPVQLINYAFISEHKISRTTPVTLWSASALVPKWQPPTSYRSMDLNTKTYHSNIYRNYRQKIKQDNNRNGCSINFFKISTFFFICFVFSKTPRPHSWQPKSNYLEEQRTMKRKRIKLPDQKLKRVTFDGS